MNGDKQMSKENSRSPRIRSLTRLGVWKAVRPREKNANRAVQSLVWEIRTDLLPRGWRRWRPDEDRHTPASRGSARRRSAGSSGDVAWP